MSLDTDVSSGIFETDPDLDHRPRAQTPTISLTDEASNTTLQEEQKLIDTIRESGNHKKTESKKVDHTKPENVITQVDLQLQEVKFTKTSEIHIESGYHRLEDKTKGRRKSSVEVNTASVNSQNDDSLHSTSTLKQPEVAIQKTVAVTSQESLEIQKHKKKDQDKRDQSKEENLITTQIKTTKTQDKQFEDLSVKMETKKKNKTVEKTKTLSFENKVENSTTSPLQQDVVPQETVGTTSQEKHEQHTEKPVEQHDKLDFTHPETDITTKVSDGEAAKVTTTQEIKSVEDHGLNMEARHAHSGDIKVSKTPKIKSEAEDPRAKMEVKKTKVATQKIALKQDQEPTTISTHPGSLDEQPKKLDHTKVNTKTDSKEQPAEVLKTPVIEFEDGNLQMETKQNPTESGEVPQLTSDIKHPQRTNIVEKKPKSKISSEIKEPKTGSLDLPAISQNVKEDKSKDIKSPETGQDTAEIHDKKFLVSEPTENDTEDKLTNLTTPTTDQNSTFHDVVQISEVSDSDGSLAEAQDSTRTHFNTHRHKTDEVPAQNSFQTQHADHFSRLIFIACPFIS